MFHYDRHEEIIITRYTQVKYMYYQPMVADACILLTFKKSFDWFCYSKHHKVQFNTLYVFIKICMMISSP